jgi:DNA-binding XRE family transcriptional regulator
MTDMVPRAELGASLRRRRAALGLTRGQMAAGIGLRLKDVHAIESGTAQNSLTDRYVVWLAIAESWPATVRDQQRERARLSERFIR